MRYGVVCSNLGGTGDVRVLVELAREAEAAGWDGFFIWDSLLFAAGERQAVADPWVALAAIAAHTERIRLGPMVTPLPRRRPWQLARETVTLDHLSGGRLIFGVGSGAADDPSYTRFGERAEPKVLGAMLDEGLAVLAGLWGGEPFSYGGEHYTVEECVFWPRPLQEPRIPVWVGGFWPNKPPFRRAARWDGVYPLALTDGQIDMTPRIFAEVVALVRRHRTGDGPFDFVASGWTSPDEPDEAARLLSAYAAAGATWFLEAADEFRGPLDAMRRRIRQGPPRAWERGA